MKKLLLQSICLILTLAWAGCTEDEETVKNLVLAEGTQTTQTVYADQTSGTGGGISFTAATDWTATVTDVTSKAESNTVSWLTLSQYSGGPGEYTLTLTLSTNLTGQTRKAQIEIRCGNDVITITVEQKAEDSEGNIPDAPIESMTYPAKVSKISYRENYWNQDEWAYPIEIDHEFKYNTEGRIAEYVYTANNPSTSDAAYKLTTSLDYNISGEIRITEQGSYDDSPESYTLIMNNHGYAERMETEGMVYQFSYNDDDRLAQISWQSDNGVSTKHTYRLKYTYTNGAPDKTTLWEDNYEYSYHAENELEYGTTPNNLLNIDPNVLFEEVTDLNASDGPNGYQADGFGGRLQRLALLRLIGKRSDYYVSRDEDNYDELSSPVTGYPADQIGQIVHETYTDYERSTSDLAYTTAGDGRINSITKKEDVTKEIWGYDVKVLNTLLYPGEPDRGYDFERIEESDKLESTSNGTNTYTYTFTYYMN